MMKLEYTPGHVEWIHSPGAAIQTLAVTEAESPTIHVYDGRGTNSPLKTLEKLHTKPVVLIKYCPKLDLTISVDKNGILGRL